MTSRKWLHKLDDLEKNDRIVVEEGNLIVTGFYKGLMRRDEKWFIVVADKGEQKWCWTMAVDDLRIIRKAGS
jgi:hypothetical protein